MFGTRKARRAAAGHFGSKSSRVLVVFMSAPFGVPRDLLVSCFGANFALACGVRRDRDAAESIRAVSLCLFGGLIQLGVSSSTSVFRVLSKYSRDYPPDLSHFSSAARSDPFGLFPKPALSMLPPIGFLRVARVQ